MAPVAALEIRGLDAILTQLNTIGPQGASWLTSAEVHEGFPGDALPTATKPRIYIDHFATQPFPEAGAGLSKHSFRVAYAVFIVGATARDVAAAKADVLRAIFAGEQAITTAVGMPAWPGEYQRKSEMETAGYFVGLQLLHLDFNVDHSTP